MKDRFLIPIVDEMLDELHVDLRAGYHQIQMREEDTHKILFKIHSNHYKYSMMPFKLCNTPLYLLGIYKHDLQALSIKICVGIL